MKRANLDDHDAILRGLQSTLSQHAAQTRGQTVTETGLCHHCHARLPEVEVTTYTDTKRRFVYGMCQKCRS